MNSKMAPRCSSPNKTRDSRATDSLPSAVFVRRGVLVEGRGPVPTRLREVVVSFLPAGATEQEARHWKREEGHGDPARALALLVPRPSGAPSLPRPSALQSPCLRESALSKIRGRRGRANHAHHRRRGGSGKRLLTLTNGITHTHTRARKRWQMGGSRRGRPPSAATGGGRLAVERTSKRRRRMLAFKWRPFRRLAARRSPCARQKRGESAHTCARRARTRLKRIATCSLIHPRVSRSIARPPLLVRCVEAS